MFLRLSGRRDTAEDLAQETWIKLAKAAPGLREDTTLGPLLFMIARNAFMSHRRWAMLDLSRIVTFGLEAMSAGATEPSAETHHERARAIALLEPALPSRAMDGNVEARLRRQARAMYVRGFDSSSRTARHSSAASLLGRAAMPVFLAGIFGLYMTWAIATATALVH